MEAYVDCHASSEPAHSPSYFSASCGDACQRWCEGREMSSYTPFVHHARSPSSTMPEEAVRVSSEYTAVGEGHKLSEECHVQLCSSKFTAVSPLALQRLCCKESGGVTSTGQITATPIAEKPLNHCRLLSLQVLCVGTQILDWRSVHNQRLADLVLLSKAVLQHSGFRGRD